MKDVNTACRTEPEGKLKPKYYKLKKKFEGVIELEEEKGIYEPATARGVIMPEEKDPIDENH